MTAPRTVLHRSSMKLAKGRTMIAPVRGSRGGAPVLRPDREPVFGVRPTLRYPNRSPTGMKPFADGIRNILPLGSPKREGRPERTRRNTGGVASSQVDLPQGGTGARVHRPRHWRDRSPLRLPECMDCPALPVSVPPPVAPREVRLNGFPGALAEVPRHRCDGGGRRVPDAARKGLSDAAYVGQPAYPPWPHSVCLPEGLAGGCAPCDPRNGNGAP